MPNPESDPVLFTAPQPLLFVEHDAILQTLDRKSNGVFLTKEHFEPTVDAWNDVPLIFAQEHPDPEKWNRDPEAELKRVKGRLVDGRARDTRIELTGHPRLMTVFDLHDKEIEDGIENGEISTSNGFWAKHDDKLLGTVRPHHILFFREKRDGPVPGDGGAFILNTTDEAKQERITPIERLKAMLLGGSEREKDHEEVIDMADEALKEMLAAARTDLAKAQETIAKLQEQLAGMGAASKEKDEEIANLKQANLEFVKRERDAEWEDFKSKHIPPGMIAGDKEKEARKLFDERPLAFMSRVLEFRKDSADEDGEEPMEFTTGKGKPRKVKVEDQLAEMGIPSLSFTKEGEQ